MTLVISPEPKERHYSTSAWAARKETVSSGRSLTTVICRELRRNDGLPDDAPPSGFGFGGIASYQPATVTENPDGTFTKTEEWTTTDKEGNETTHSRSSTSDGSSFVGQTTVDESGTYRTTRSKNADGTVTFIRISTGQDGTGGAESFRRDPDGTLWRTEGPATRRSDGGYDVDWGDQQNAEGSRNVPQWILDIGGNPGDDGTTASQQALADWLWRQHQLGRHSPGGSGPADTTLVNPGDPDYEGAYVNDSSIAAGFTDSIAVNPDPNDAGNSGADPSARALSAMLQDLVDGPGPGPEPGPRP